MSALPLPDPRLVANQPSGSHRPPLGARPSGGAAATLTIDLNAVAANTETLSGRARGELMAVVKADGFGHGAAEVARTALVSGATWLGVTSIAEAIGLRTAGIEAPILSWLNPVDAPFAAALTDDLDIGVPSLDHLDAVSRCAQGARIHLMIDTGMGRDGCPPERWSELCRSAAALERSGLIQVVGLMGHLPCADVPSDPSNSRGRALFRSAQTAATAAGLRPRHRHLAATAATLNDSASHHTMCRVGAGLVGIDPTRPDLAQCTLQPALTLRAPLIEVRRIAAGTPVGYGHRWRAAYPTVLGLLPIGYADGLPRIAGEHSAVSINGRRCPIAGTISMDMTVVDLGPRSAARPGTIATVFGPGDDGEPTTAEWADWADTIEHEIVTGLGPRIGRRVLGPTSDAGRSWRPRVVPGD